MEFVEFRNAMQQKFREITETNDKLFITNVDKDLIWSTYLDSFLPGTNEVFRERSEYDCNTCKHFLKPYANIVAIVNNKLVSIWDFEIEGKYQPVAKALSELVKSAPIKDVFVTKFANLGTEYNYDRTANIRWEHFYHKLPAKFVSKSSKSEESIMGANRDNKNVFKRSLEEITQESIETVLELISQNSLYKGNEYKKVLTAFLKYKKAYQLLKENEKDNFCWANYYKERGSVSKIRNSAIGTLLIDLSDKMELDKAVKRFENVVAPTNYKRPKAIVTKSMVESAQKKIIEMGFEDSLERRFANMEDITINNVIFANKDAKKAMNVFDEMKSEIPVNKKSLSKVEEISIDDFIENVLPNINSIELLFENKNESNLMSLIAPKNKTAPTMFKWNNNFSWAYNGDITDSIKERVKAAGGRVKGVLRFSIQWNENNDNRNDFDAHCIEPNNNHIQFPNKGRIHPSSGRLDIDIVNPGNKVAVENIIWTNKSKMQEGEYDMFVHNYTNRGGTSGFAAEIEFDGKIFSFEYRKPVRQGERIKIANVTYDKKNGFKIVKLLPTIDLTKEIWGIYTNKFHKVSTILYSPNYWDEQSTGNKHYFFMLEGCKNPTSPRGFFNEFLKEELMEQKRVFELLGSKMKVESSENQLSGLGFSSTQRNNVIVKVEGNFKRTIKIKF